MKKFVCTMMVLVMLIGTFANAEGIMDDFESFCNGMNTDIVLQQEGCGTMYIKVNDIEDHRIMLYTDDIKSDTVEMCIYEGNWEEEISGPIILNSNNYEVELNNVMYTLYEREVVNRDYLNGHVSSEYRDAMLFKYRITNW